MSGEALLPCPFCGGTPQVYGGAPVFDVVCAGPCLLLTVHTGPYGTRTEAIAAWNRRAPAPEPTRCSHPHGVVVCGGCGERICLACQADGCPRCLAEGGPREGG